jgi:type I restriction enzyme, S subunit
MSELNTGWRNVKFGDVVRQVKDRVDPEAEGLDRYVAGEHMDTDSLQVRRWGTVGDGYLGPAFHMRFRPGHVLYGSRRTYLRKIAVADYEGVCANTTFVLEPSDPEVLLPELLPFVMQAKGFHDHSVRESRGSVNPYVNFSDLAWYEFALPPLEHQRRIADLLTASTCAVDSYRHSLGNAHALESAWAATEMVRMTEVYPSVPASTIVDRATVGIVVKPAQYYVTPPAGVPALRSLNVAPNRLDFADVVHISEAGHASNQKSALRPGDVVVVRSGRPGDAAVIPEDAGPLNCIDLIVVTPSPRLMPEFLAAVLNSPYGRRQFLSGTAGTAQKHFNVGAFRLLRVPVPPLSAQVPFVDMANQLRTTSARIQTRFQHAQRMHSGLVHDLLEVPHV